MNRGLASRQDAALREGPACTGPSRAIQRLDGSCVTALKAFTSPWPYHEL